ncbi:MAG: terminase large subunit domain-containing protein [Sphingomicrobium sp.]
MRTLMRLFGGCPPQDRERVWALLPASYRRGMEEQWSWQARPAQLCPKGAWDVWLIMAGRGWGKTRAGAEWVLRMAREQGEARIALVGASLDEAARVMVEGESGLLACAQTGERIEWRPTKGELRFGSGAVAQLYSGASPEGLRGPQHHFAWADELGKWAHPQRTWDMLNMGLRLGEKPRALITTTPRPLGLLRRLLDDPTVAKSGGPTFHTPSLPDAFVDSMRHSYAGTRLGRQELGGELLGETEGALWTRAMIEACRCAMPARSELARVVVAVDPPASAEGDECGILVCARLGDGRGVVLADCSVGGERPQGWARRVAAAARAWDADRVVAEANNGGEMVAEVLRTVAPALPLRLVHARRGKGARAEPVALQFEAGRCLFAGQFAELEDQLTAMTPDGYRGSGSPDRADAMVWALTELVVRPPAVPRVRGM